MAALALLAAVFAPSLLAASHPLAALLIRSFFAHLCHQIPGRSLVVDGAPIAVCVRCLGIYCGTALAAILPIQRLHARQWLATALLLNLSDVLAQTLHCYGNLPLSRFCLGVLLGFAAATVLCSSANERESSPGSSQATGQVS
jgi:uncharacterized membrane protein